MKQKNSNDPATKADLANVNTGLKAEIENVNTGLKSLKIEVKVLRNDMLRLEERIEGLEDSSKQYRNELGSKMDYLIKKFETLEEDRLIGAHQTAELRREVDQHEKRLTKIEKLQHAT